MATEKTIFEEMTNEINKIDAVVRCEEPDNFFEDWQDTVKESLLKIASHTRTLEVKAKNFPLPGI